MSEGRSKMKCIKCESELHYGDKFCNSCGEKIEKAIYEEDYKKTIWGKIDKISDWWEMLTLKKFIGHWLTKVIVLVLVLGWGIFDAYTELTNIKFLESENYTVEYNRKADEYYVRTSEEEVELNLYIPRHSEKITVTEYEGEVVKESKDIFPDDYKQRPLKVKNNESVCITVSSVRNEKITDTVKFYVGE